jgi:outer membrane autotransporter protein
MAAMRTAFSTRGILAYSGYGGDSERDVVNEDVQGRLEGDPESHVLGFYGETGYRFGLSGAATSKSFAGPSLATAELEGFTEDDPDGTGVALTIEDSDADSVASMLGLSLTDETMLSDGLLVLELSVAWQHESSDEVQQVGMTFVGGPPGTGFNVISAEVPGDSFLVQAGVSYALSEALDMGFSYTGRFNEEYSAQAVTARFSYRF